MNFSSYSKKSASLAPDRGSIDLDKKMVFMGNIRVIVNALEMIWRNALQGESRKMEHFS